MSYVDAADYDFYLRCFGGVAYETWISRWSGFATTGQQDRIHPARQVEEAHRIRLRYARGAGERWLMAAAFRVMRARGALASPWPEL